jgi:hypothetical protein
MALAMVISLSLKDIVRPYIVYWSKEFVTTDIHKLPQISTSVVTN